MVHLGDGRSDSPRHCARYCSYVVMENETGTVLGDGIM